MNEQRTIRLACMECDTDAYDGITPVELQRLITEGGWGCVEEVQSHEESVKVYTRPEDEPTGYSVLDWYTHIGTCPQCRFRLGEKERQ